MYLQLDTKFNPFTYDEMVKPLVYYKEAYDKAEEAYSNLTQQTESFRDVVNQETSPEAFQMYQRYSGDLNNVVDDFSKGMTTRNRRALMGLKKRYSQDIVPIAKASEAMDKANDFRDKAGPDAIFEVGRYNSLDQFLHGKTANNKYESRDTITKTTAAMTQAIMAEAVKDPEFKKVMGDQYWMITQHSGGSYEELMDAIKQGMLNNPVLQNKFSEIRNKVAKDFNINKYDSQGQRAMMSAIDTGLYAGLDKPAFNFQANQDHITPLQAASLRASRGGGGGGRSSSRRGSSSSEDSEDAEEYEVMPANDVILTNITNYSNVHAIANHGGPKGLKPSPYGAVLVDGDAARGTKVPNFEGLAKWPELQTIARAHIGNDDPSNYEYYVGGTYGTSSIGIKAKPSAKKGRKVKGQRTSSNSSNSSSPTDNYLGEQN